MNWWQKILRFFGWKKQPTLKVVESVQGTLGDLSAKYESGRRGPGTISSGKNDPGGKSYGTHQLSLKAGTLARYLKESEFKDYFLDLKPGTSQFDSMWRKLAKHRRKDFEKEQRDFITRTYYEPAFKYAASLGFDVKNRGIQEAVYSMAVQHDRDERILKTAATEAIPGDTITQIRALYYHRAQYVQGLKLHHRTKKAVLNRYKREVEDAIAYA